MGSKKKTSRKDSSISISDSISSNSNNEVDDDNSKSEKESEEVNSESEKSEKKVKKAKKNKVKSEESEKSEEESNSSESEKSNKKRKKTDSEAEAKKRKEIIKKNGEAVFCLDMFKRVSVRKFKGKLYVDIREFYQAGEEYKPGKKGISLSMDAWEEFLSNLDKIKEAVEVLKK